MSLNEKYVNRQCRLTAVGFYGSQGEVIYDVPHPKDSSKTIQVRIEFCDPFGRWNDNYLRARASDPKFVSCNVLDYQLTGHPFTGK